MNPDVEWLISKFKTQFRRPDGLLARNYPVQARSLFDNFDDLAPFFLYYDQADFLLEQVRLIQKQNENFVSLCADHGFLHTSTTDEFFGGLYSVWKATQDKPTFQLLQDSLAFVETYLLESLPFLPAAYDVSNKKPVHFYEPWSAGLLETFCEMREDFPALFEKAGQVLHAWVTENYFQKYGLFPYRVFQNPTKKWMHQYLLSFFEPRSHTRAFYSTNPLTRHRLEWTCGYYSQLMKSNSTPAFTFLEFYRASGNCFWLDHLETWIQSVLQFFLNHETGAVYDEYLPRLNRKRNSGITPAFILVDVICDAAYFHERFQSYLPKAQKILQYYWDNERLENGLMAFRFAAHHAHIDSQIDFSISMRRYAELTSEKHWLDRSMQLTRQALSVHRSEQGYYTYSGTFSGQNIIDPKYNALVLKGVINLETSYQSLYPALHSIFKDR